MIHPQEMTFIDQASAFASARRIVAPFGAALANGMFCRRNVDLCVIATKRTPEFSRLYQWLDTNISYVTPQGYKVRKGWRHSSSYEFLVDLGQLDEFVSRRMP